MKSKYKISRYFTSRIKVVRFRLVYLLASHQFTLYFYFTLYFFKSSCDLTTQWSSLTNEQEASKAKVIYYKEYWV